MRWTERLRRGEFLVVVEVLPPKGADLQGFEKKLVPVKGLVDAVYLPSLQGAVMRASPWGVAKPLRDRGYEVIFEVSCAHQNRLALQAELLGAALLGLENVVVVEGDDPKLGDHPEAKPVFDVHVKELLGGLAAMKRGKDMAGGDLEAPVYFCVGAKVDASLDGPSLEGEWEAMAQMVELGVEFFFTTSVYDLRKMERFMQGASKLGVPVLAGVMLLKSAGMARYLQKHVPGVYIPEEVVERLLYAADRTYASVKLASELIRGLKGICQGVEIVTLGWEDKVPMVLEEVSS